MREDFATEQLSIGPQNRAAEAPSDTSHGVGVGDVQVVEKVVQVHCQTEDVKTMSGLVRCTMTSQVRRYDTEVLCQSGDVTLKDLGGASKTVQLRVFDQKCLKVETVR